MFEREDYRISPSMMDMSNYINNSLWEDFCKYMKEKYEVNPIFEFSKCSFEYGWNVKFKKKSKTLCTLYPRENYFTIMVVIGRKEKDKFLELFPRLSLDIKETYLETKEGNNQKWLMIDLEDSDKRYEDVKKIIDIRNS